MTETDIVKALGGLPEGKLNCSVLGIQAIRDAVADYLLYSVILQQGLVKDRVQYESALDGKRGPWAPMGATVPARPWGENESNLATLDERSKLIGVEERKPMIMQNLWKAVEAEAVRRSIADIRLGLGYTAVVLDDGRTGVAYTLRDSSDECCCILQEAGSLRGRSVESIFRQSLNGPPLWRSIGAAAINALAPDGEFPESEGNILDFFQVGTEDRVGMVGYFAPLMKLEHRVKELLVLEEKALGDDRTHPAHRAPHILPTCSVVILTAVSVVNGTFDQLIGLCKGAREVVLVGPSTPMFPRVFASYGLTLLGGIRIADTPGLLQVISEGGGTRQFGSTVRKVTVRIRA
ncbi:MAG: iron-sulfur cluster assembly scaffold protein [Deltaproteobacteria bacterium]|nr:iron-sulfur cluster assembly scaffold protein [Deltaproteobacteria bacterium]